MQEAVARLEQDRFTLMDILGFDSDLSDLSADEDEDVDAEEAVEREPSSLTRLTAQKECFDDSKQDVYTMSAWVEVEGEELRVYKPSEKGGNVKEGWIISEQGKVGPSVKCILLALLC
jgi:hypothetical protein